MSQGIKQFVFLFLLCLIFLSGIIIFLKGFLLSRTSIYTKSACDAEFAKRVNPPSHKHEVEGCWMHGRFKKAVLILVDALRHDFLIYNASAGDGAPFYVNKFWNVDYFLTRKPLQSRLYKFRADPPTTTMQRLKGLTTGSLPTFVDAGSNFQSYEIMEDSWLHQLRSSQKRVKFLGDDTWLGLYPNIFKKSYAFPSFDVKDLHTVDNNILKHLYSEMSKKDWDVMIAHFLGVDHCGHRYGPNHRAMAEKLSQMDNVIRSVANLIKNDTILFVMGDHGMTRTGDHGGDSEEELMAGLFIYSPSQLASSPQDKFDNTVVQTDFVPTISLLLGLPIPYSNLGMIIPELFSHCPWWKTDNDVKKVYHKVKALRLNARQVDTYLDSYHQVSSDLPRKEMRSLSESIQKFEKEAQSLVSAVASGQAGNDVLNTFIELEKNYISYLREARKMCENVWAKFDLKIICAGIVTLILGIILAFYFLFSLAEKNENQLTATIPFVSFGMVLHILYLAIHIFFLPDSVPPLMVYIIAFVLIFICILSIKAQITSYLQQTFSFYNMFVWVIAGFSCSVYFSNSFVVYEDVVSIFLLLSLILSFWCKVSANIPSKTNVRKLMTAKNTKRSETSFDIIKILTHLSHIRLILILVCAIFIRLSSNFFACREEQHRCEDSLFLTPLSNFDQSLRNQRYVFSVICLGAIVYISRYWLKYYGNLNGTSASVICLSYAPSVAAVFTCLHWAFQTLPQAILDSIPKWQQVLMAQIVYFVFIICLASIIISPLLIYILPSRQESPINLSKGAIPSLYNQIKLQASQPQEEEKAPMVYGLGSVYSASVVALCLTITLLLCLLLNDGVTPAVLSAYISFYIALELYSAAVNTGGKQDTDADSDKEYPAWSGIILLSLFSNVFFFATGHQATIPSIRMEAAYTGFYGDFNSYILPVLLIWTNTFASQVLFGLASPLLIFWPYLSSGLSTWMTKDQKTQQTQEGTWNGDFHLFNNGVEFRRKLFQFFTGIVLVCGIKILAASCAATIHRRHLMVWKIFAPRLIYEAGMFLTTSFCLCLVFLFLLRTDSALSKFVRTLPSQKVNQT